MEFIPATFWIGLLIVSAITALVGFMLQFRRLEQESKARIAAIYKEAEERRLKYLEESIIAMADRVRKSQARIEALARERAHLRVQMLPALALDHADSLVILNSVLTLKNMEIDIEKTTVSIEAAAAETLLLKHPDVEGFIKRLKTSEYSSV
jgi:hypothetical protein